MERTKIWITRVKDDWFLAKDDDDKLVAKAPNLQQLEISLDIMFKNRWMGYLTL